MENIKLLTDRIELLEIKVADLEKEVRNQRKRSDHVFEMVSYEASQQAWAMEDSLKVYIDSLLIRKK